MGPYSSIAIKSSDGKYLCADGNSLSFQDCSIYDAKIRFLVPSGVNIIIQSYERKLLSLVSTSTLTLTDNTKPVTSNEIFTIIPLGANKVAVKASNDKFLNSTITANSVSISDSETFEIIHLYI